MPKMQSTSAVPASRPREGVHLRAWGAVAILAGLLSVVVSRGLSGLDVAAATRGIMPYRELAMYRGARDVSGVHNPAFTAPGPAFTAPGPAFTAPGSE